MTIRMVSAGSAMLQMGSTGSARMNRVDVARRAGADSRVRRAGIAGFGCAARDGTGRMEGRGEIWVL